MAPTARQNAYMSLLKWGGLQSRKGRGRHIRTFTLKPKPESGLDCLRCAMFARQRSIDRGAQIFITPARRATTSRVLCTGHFVLNTNNGEPRFGRTELDSWLQRALSASNPRPVGTASKRRGNARKDFKDFDLETKGGIWP